MTAPVALRMSTIAVFEYFKQNDRVESDIQEKKKIMQQYVKKMRNKYDY